MHFYYLKQIVICIIVNILRKPCKRSYFITHNNIIPEFKCLCYVLHWGNKNYIKKYFSEMYCWWYKKIYFLTDVLYVLFKIPWLILQLYRETNGGRKKWWGRVLSKQTCPYTPYLFHWTLASLNVIPKKVVCRWWRTPKKRQLRIILVIYLTSKISSNVRQYLWHIFQIRCLKISGNIDDTPFK